MVEIKLSPEEEKLREYVFSDKPEHQQILVQKLKSIVSSKIFEASVDFIGVTVNNAGQLHIDGYLELTKGYTTYIVEMHITIDDTLYMKFEAGTLWFFYDLRDRVNELLNAFEGRV